MVYDTNTQAIKPGTTAGSEEGSAQDTETAMIDTMHIAELSIYIRWQQRDDMAAGAWQVLQYADDLGRRLPWYEVQHGEISEAEKQAALLRARQLANGK
jgi:hypothetical protein